MTHNIHKAGGVLTAPGDVHINAALTNVSFAYMQEAAGFIADKVFPTVQVAKQSDLIWKFDPQQFNRNTMRKRAPSTEAPIIGLTQSTDNYYAHVWSVGHDISDQTRANADLAFNLDRQATDLLSNSALINKEVSFIESFLTAGKWGTDLTGVSATPSAGQFLQWSDPASTPIEDIRFAKRQVKRRTGIMPNKLVLGRKTYDILVDHPDIVDRVKYGQTPNGAALVNKQAMAALFEVEEILVADAVVNSDLGAIPGTVDTTDFVFDNGALLVYTPRTASIQMPAAGLTYSWTGYTGANGFGGRIKKFRMEAIESDRIEINMAYDQRIIGNQLGVFFDDAVPSDA